MTKDDEYANLFGEEFKFKISLVFRAFNEGVMEFITNKFMKETDIEEQLSAMMYLLETKEEKE